MLPAAATCCLTAIYLVRKSSVDWQIVERYKKNGVYDGLQIDSAVRCWTFLKFYGKNILGAIK
jgi:hypothetical protein